MNLIVAGSQSFDDYDLLAQKLDHLLCRTDRNQVVFFCSNCPGAEQYAKSHGIKLRRYPASCEELIAPGAPAYRIPKALKSVRFDATGLMVRDAEKDDAALVLFWDSPDKAQSSLLDLAHQKGFRVRVITCVEKEVEAA